MSTLNIFEEKEKELGWMHGDGESFEFPAFMPGIQFKMTVLAPEDGIYIHPTVMREILNCTTRNQIIDIIRRKP